MKILVPILSFLILPSCKRNDSARKNIDKINDTGEFRIPFIYQPQIVDSVFSFRPNHVNDAFFKICGKSFPTDTLKVSFSSYTDSSVVKDLDRNLYDAIFSNLRYDGFEIQPDYKSTVYKHWIGADKLFPFYPVYIINNTSENRFFPGKDSYAFGIQEALDTNGNWRPIEGRGFDFCGNGYWYLKIKPKEFLVLLIHKYGGDYKTQLRVRAKIGNMVYVSQYFEGSINYNQFLIEKGSNFADCLKEDKSSTIQNIFYGSVPLGINRVAVVSHAVIAQEPVK